MALQGCVLAPPMASLAPAKAMELFVTLLMPLLDKVRSLTPWGREEVVGYHPLAACASGGLGGDGGWPSPFSCQVLMKTGGGINTILHWHRL